MARRWCRHAGVAETDAKGEEYARGHKLVEDIWIGKQTVNGKPFGIITLKDDVSAMQLLEAHSCGGGEMREVFGKWSVLASQGIRGRPGGR